MRLNTTKEMVRAYKKYINDGFSGRVVQEMSIDELQEIKKGSLAGYRKEWGGKLILVVGIWIVSVEAGSDSTVFALPDTTRAVKPSQMPIDIYEFVYNT